MTDQTLTPEVFGDFGLHLAAIRQMAAPLVIEPGDFIVTRSGNYTCIYAEGDHVWCKSAATNAPIDAHVWTRAGEPVTLQTADRSWRVIAIMKAGVAV